MNLYKAKAIRSFKDKKNSRWKGHKGDVNKIQWELNTYASDVNCLLVEAKNDISIPENIENTFYGAQCPVNAQKGVI